MSLQNHQNDLAVLIQAGVNPMAMGDPGTGKTASFIAVIQAMDRQEIMGTRWFPEVLILVTRDPTDLGGIPCMVDGDLRFMPPAFATRAKARIEKGFRTFIFLDELNRAPMSTQNAALRPIMDGYIGDYWLDPEWVKWGSAVNDPNKVAGATEMDPAMANRFHHIDWVPDMDSWKAGMMSGWPDLTVPAVQDGWGDRVGHWASLIVSFVERHSQHFCPEVKGGALAYPSLRSWSGCAEVLAAGEAAGYDESGRLRLASGAVGSEVAGQFITFVRECDLPLPQEMRDNPECIPLDRTDRTLAALNTLVADTIRLKEAKSWEATIRACAHVKTKGQGDKAMMAVLPLYLKQNVPAGATMQTQMVEFAEMASRLTA